MGNDEIVVSTEQLHDTVLELTEKINRVYDGIEKLVIVVLLEGARPFAHDLVKHLNLPLEIVYIKTSSYNGGTSSSGKVDIQKQADLEQKMSGKNVLIIDDIYDTGITLDSVTKSLASLNPKNIKICVLLEKKIKHKVEVPIDFLGLKIEDLFVIGYGLDHNEKYRELPFIATFPETQI